MKLAEMNGFPGLLQSTLAIPEEDDMFLRSSSSNVETVFVNWKKEGNCFEEGKKLQLRTAKHPDVLNSIDNALILTGVGINAFSKSVSKYIDLMLHMPLAADFVLAKLLNLVDYYVYAVTTLFAALLASQHAVCPDQRRRSLSAHRALHSPLPERLLPRGTCRGRRNGLCT